MKSVPSRLFRRSLMSVGGLAGLAMLALAPTPAAAQGTPEQRAYCQDDAMRLCGEFVPDVDRITACMKRHRRNLSPACRRVFDGGGRRRS